MSLSVHRVATAIAPLAFILLLNHGWVPAASFDDIDFWVGDGVNRAAVVIDWNEDLATGPAVAWGYRWNGVATGYDMLRAVLTADPRVVARMSPTDVAAIRVYGFGYDWNGSGPLELSDGTTFDCDGIAVTGASEVATPIDPTDVYAEGWTRSGYWHYTTAEGTTQGDWSSGQQSMVHRALASGDWDGWTFTSFLNPDGSLRTFEDLESTFPGQPVAGPPPTLPGDMNADGAVDAADYTVWRDHLGTAAPVPGGGGDADFSGTIDGADYALWRDGFAASAGAASSAAPLPEVSSLAAILTFVAAGWLARRYAFC